MKHCNVIKTALAAAVTALVCAGCGAATADSATADSPPALTSQPLTSAPAASLSETSSQTEPVTESSVPETYSPRSELLKCLYYDDREFCTNTEESVIYDTAGVPLCGVAPHHLAAGHFIAGMYRTAAEKREHTDTVILTAPMHYDGKSSLVTSLNGWETAFGSVQCDTDIAELLTDELGAVPDDEMMQLDHSASSHIPFIKRYLPDAKVVCLLVSPKEPGGISERIAALYNEIAEMKNCFFAFSIDFSHYLDPDKTNVHDKETLDAVLSGDTDRIAQFTNANVDTPYCLNAFVKLSGLLGRDVVKADNSNTWLVSGLPYDRTLFPEGVTSYFVFFS